MCQEHVASDGVDRFLEGGSNSWCFSREVMIVKVDYTIFTNDQG